MQRITRDLATTHEMIVKDPLLAVKPGEKFVVETEDTFSGMIRASSTLPIQEHLGVNGYQKLLRFELNPLSGPVHIEGAEKGDVLVVNIHDIIPDEQGFSCILPGIGPLHDSAKWSKCRGPYTHIIKHLPGPSGTTSDGKGVFNERITWNLHPLIGTIGVATERPVMAGSDSVVGQGPHGGNLDCRDICKGSKLFLPIFQKGAYLYMGDVHASQGDTEFHGLADETGSEITLSCDLIKRKSIPFPRIEKIDSIIQLNSYRPLDDTITQAMLWLIDWLVTDYNMDPREAYLLMSVNPEVRVNVYQMVQVHRIQYTVGVEFPKSHL